MSFRTIDGLDARGKRVLVRADLNVPVRDGKISDLTRIERLSPTIRELAAAGARVAVCSHFDRPKGKRVASMSLSPMAAALAEVLGAKVTRRRARRSQPCATARWWCWRTRASIPARRRTTRYSPPNWPIWPISSSTMRFPPRIAPMPAPRASHGGCHPMPGG
jgi:hypothetical protein